LRDDSPLQYLPGPLAPMSAILEDAVVERLRARFPCYHETAYLFILSALQFTIQRLESPRHISGRELAEGCRDLALERWGPMAGAVLEYWGIRSTRDLGEIVFALVDCGVLIKQDRDSVLDFEDLYDFVSVFERDYPWSAQALNVIKEH